VRDYFQSIERFIVDNPLFPDPIDQILIRSEKHGTLYHVASVEIIGLGARRKFAVSIAFSEPRKELLLREYETMRYLNQRFPYGYLPKVHMASEVPCSCPKGNETAVMSVSECWKGTRVAPRRRRGGEASRLIWDMEKGNRTASAEEGRSIFGEASRILTLYYDPKTFRQIYPWHHAAGDFVVNLSEGIVQVKLTAARNYLPLISFPTKADSNRVTALVAFLLNMLMQMRLDRIGGVSEPVWAQEEFVGPCLEGFFRALQTLKAEGREIGDKSMI